MRKGDWMQVYNRGMFYPQDPILEEIDIRDIAHSLSLQCRFAGHCRCFYSVAEHSIRVSKVCGFSQKSALWGLLHDASEAYLVDLPRPVKRASELGEEYMVLEERIMGVILKKYHLENEMPECVKVADEQLLATEARDLMSIPPRNWNLSQAPLVHVIEPMKSAQAEFEFLEMFYKLSA